MNVALFNTDDSRGGAARSAMRLHDALLAENTNSSFLVRQKHGIAPHVIEVGQAEALLTRSAGVVQEFYLNRRRTSVTNTLLSLAYPNIGCATHPLVEQADVLNLHWVTNFLGAPEIDALLATGKPLVWTFHDQWAMTGGCHYTAGCRQFTDACKVCPQLTEDPAGLIETTFQEKLEAYADLITVVTPSKWMGGEARASRLFRNSRIEVIPYSLDLQAFAPRGKKEIRQTMGIPDDAFVFLFACSAAVESRKGGAFLKEIMLALSRKPEIQSMREAGKIWLLCFGWDTTVISTGHFSEKHLGFLPNDQALCEAYNAADILLHLSTEDNLPNTVLESMACGTPVLAADIGGARDLLGENQSGWLLDYGNADAFSNRMVTLMAEPGARAAAGIRARQKIEAEYVPSLQASRYLKLFSELVKSPGLPAKAPPLKRVQEKFFDLLQYAAHNAVSDLTRTKEQLTTEGETLKFQVKEAGLENAYIKTENKGLLTTVAQKEQELQSTLLQLERAKRNIGYRVAHGVTRGLKSVENAVRPTRKP